MKAPMKPEVALDRLEALCARSEQCTFDLRTKLRTWGIPSSQSEDIMESLRERRFVDDSRFAMAFCRDKYRFNRWGRLKIRAGLIAKHIDQGAIDCAIDAIEEDVYLDNLVALLRAKKASMGAEAAATYEGRTKLLRFAMSRGYEASIAIDALKSINTDDDDVWDG